MATEFFVIRTRDRLYVGPLGFTPEIEKAVFFPTRMAALRRCAEIGGKLEGAAIVSYSPATATEAAGVGSATPKRSRTPWRAK